MRQLVLYLDIDTDDPIVARQIGEHIAHTLDDAALPCKVAVDSLEVWQTGEGNDGNMEIETTFADFIEDPQSKEGLYP